MKKTFIAMALAGTALSGTAQAADLRMSWWGGDSRHEATQEALKVCGEKHGHTIQPEFTGWGGHFEKVATQIAGKTEADIMQINWPWLPIFSKNGDGFADLNTLSDTIDLSNWTEDQLAAGVRNGALNGLPISTTGRIFVFNKTMFDKAGLALPQTWDELMAAGPVFAEKLGDNYYPFEGIALDASLIIQAYLTQKTGTPFIDPETNEVTWSKEDIVEGLNFYKAMVDNHVIQAWGDVAAAGNIALHENPKWVNGEIAGTLQWDSTYFKISDPLAEGMELDYVGMLSQDGEKTEGIYRKASMVFSISANTDEPEAAAQIVNCLLNEPEGIAAMGTARGVPASSAALTQLSEADAFEPMQLKAQEQVLKASGPAISPFMEDQDVRSAIEDSLELFAYGEISAEEAADEMLYGIQEFLDDLK
ncbi:ABC transporter substrate-binding protein [Oceanicola sp. S124]|uniref:ABC transporter substrate-binding protein n=1 Tax=Oceanicola sp. S124 TaxID=1042378 RepID=UPI00031CE4AB|nr:ABC transporter substrate-binding protein [Oceanicola sp. S124]